jgi:hypothetical protein
MIATGAPPVGDRSGAASPRVSLAPMAEDSSSHRLRTVLYLLVLGTAAWAAARTWLGTVPPAAPAAEPALPAPPPAPPAPVAPPAPAPARPAVDMPTTELPVVDAPGGRTARRRAALAEIPASAALALPDGSAPAPAYTIKAKAGAELFHGPDSPYFSRTRADFWFRTAADARAAGFTEWTPRRRS